MLRKFVYATFTLALGSLCISLARPGQTQTTYEADAYGSVTITTAQSGSFSYTLFPGGITTSVSSAGTGFVFADGSTAVLTSAYSSTPDTVQTTATAYGTTAIHLDKASSAAGTPEQQRHGDRADE